MLWQGFHCAAVFSLLWAAQPQELGTTLDVLGIHDESVQAEDEEQALRSVRSQQELQSSAGSSSALLGCVAFFVYSL